MTNREIANYYKQKFPESCLAYNDMDDVYDESELLKELDDGFAYEVIGLCGCGSPNLVKRNIRDVLRICTDFNEREKKILEYFHVNSFYDNSLLLFMVYILNDKGLLEHGTSISGSWITDFGKMYLEVLEKLDLDT